MLVVVVVVGSVVGGLLFIVGVSVSWLKKKG